MLKRKSSLKDKLDAQEEARLEKLKAEKATKVEGKQPKSAKK
jgi:hypothetical protein